MIKEVSLFAVGTAGIVYLIAPSLSNKAAVPEEPALAEKVAPAKKPAPQVVEDDDYDEDEVDEFVFGEPMTFDDSDDVDDDDVEEESYAEDSFEDNSFRDLGGDDEQPAKAVAQSKTPVVTPPEKPLM